MNNPGMYSRRNMIKAALAAIALPAIGLEASALAAAGPVAAGDRWCGLKIGVASYTLRSMPLDAAIKAIRRVGLYYVSIKDFHLPLRSSADERRAAVKKFRDAGITPLSCGVIGMKNDEANVRHAFEYARDAGIPTIVCDPDPAAMPILDKMVKEYDMRLAIHNHGPESKHFRTPADVYEAIKAYDARIGLCIDVGHTARAGADPAEAILKFRDRLYDVHLKDVSKAEAKGSTVENGRGVLDLKSILAALLKIQYAHLAAFEYEKDGNDPLPGLAETVGYTKGLLAGMAD